MLSKLEEAAKHYRAKATAYDEARQLQVRVEQELKKADQATRSAQDDLYEAKNALAEVALRESR